MTARVAETHWVSATGPTLLLNPRDRHTGAVFQGATRAALDRVPLGHEPPNSTDFQELTWLKPIYPREGT